MIGLVVGALFGVGVAVVATAFGPANSLSELLDDRGPDHGVAGGGGESWPGRNLFARVVESPAVNDLFVGTRFAGDLGVCERNRVDFVALTAGKAVIPFVAVMTFAYLGDFGHGVSAVMFALCAALVLALGEVRAIQAEADQRRQEMLHAVTAYIEFCRITAHTMGPEGAMRTSARMGATWPFRLIERVFDEARRHGRAPWKGLADLGERYDLREIIELAGALEIAAEEGTKVQEMLAAKASSLRRRMTEAEVALADASTEKLAVPMALIGLTIFGLLLAPAALAF